MRVTRERACIVCSSLHAASSLSKHLGTVKTHSTWHDPDFVSACSLITCDYDTKYGNVSETYAIVCVHPRANHQRPQLCLTLPTLIILPCILHKNG